MSGIFGTLNVANKGMQASQTALHTASHNISNSNTEGYSRQRVELKADLAFTYGGVGQLGTGVKMDSIVRLVDDYVTRQIQQENGTLQQYTSKSEVMEQLEIIFNEPSDVGINFNLGEMFTAWQELSKNPESLNSKSIVVEKSKTLADTLNHVSNQLNSLKDDTEIQIKKNVDDFNSITEKLDSLNKQIFNISVKGQVPNDLLDQRDVFLKDLSSITDFKSEFNKYGGVIIKLGEEVVLDESNINQLSIDEITDDIVLNGKTITSSKGQIAGYKAALNELSDKKTELDDFAKTMAEAINKVHRAGSSGLDFFTGIDDGEINAESIQLNIDIRDDNELVNASNSVDSPDGDGSRALEIARVRNEKIPFNSGDITIEGKYNDIVTKVGISKEQSDNMVANQEVLLDQLILRRESTSGVSIDEEMSNVIKFQKSYEANARVISILSEMLDVLINRTGV